MVGTPEGRLPIGRQRFCAFLDGLSTRQARPMTRALSAPLKGADRDGLAGRDTSSSLKFASAPRAESELATHTRIRVLPWLVPGSSGGCGQAKGEEVVQ